MTGRSLCLLLVPARRAQVLGVSRGLGAAAAAPARGAAWVWLALLLAWTVLALGPARLTAQTDPMAQPDLIVSNTEIGLGYFKPGCWGVAKATVTNPADMPAQFTVELLLDSSQGIEYRRPLWLPAHSRRWTWLPLILSAGAARADKGLDASGLLLAADGSGERVVARHRYLLMGSTRPYQLRVLTADQGDPSFDLADSVTLDAGPHRHTLALPSSHLPPVALGYEGLDGLIVSDPRPVLDAAQWEALRQWLWTGGHLWVALDRVDPAFLTRLLGAQWQTAVVDHVALTHFSIEALDPGTNGEHNQPDYPRDQPVDMVRVLPGNLEVTHTCKGWPAALRGTIGRGTLLVTTIAARGWFDAQEQPAPPLDSLVAIFRRAPAPIEARAWSAFATDHLGYRVPTRLLIASLLGGFCVAVLAAGVWLRRAGRLEHIGATAAVLSVLTVGILLTVGLAQRYRTPASAASAALVEAFAGQATILERGSVGVYSPGGQTADLEVVGAATLIPETAPQAARPAQLVWQDIDRYLWHDIDFPSGGVRSLGFSLFRRLDPPIAAHARFGPAGLTGDLAGIGAGVADALVLGPNGHLAIHQPDPASFTADVPDTLPEDQFVTGSTGLGLLSSEQALRQDVYRQYLRQSVEPTPLTLCGWTAGFDPGFGPSDLTRRLNTCLLTVPITLDRSEPGATVRVPAAFIGFRVERVHIAPARPAATPGPAMRPPLDFQVYNPQTAQWQDLRHAETFVLRFRLPDSVLPLQLTSALLTLDLTAPGRSVAIRSLSGPVVPGPATTGDGARGILVAQLADPQRLIPAGQAEICALVKVGPAPDEHAQVPPAWHIRRAALDVEGVAP